LVASRAYEDRRQVIDWSKIPFAETKIPSSFVLDHDKLLAALGYAICLYARDQRTLVDSHVLASLKALAETYRTLSRGIYYESPPEHRIQRQLYDTLKDSIQEYKRREEQRMGLSKTRDNEIRDALVLLTQVGSTHANGRPKGRAYLDFLRGQFDSEDFSMPRSPILLVP